MLDMDIYLLLHLRNVALDHPRFYLLQFYLFQFYLPQFVSLSFL